jgi:aspartate racemase
MRAKLGVIGGMGPEATSYFYEEVIAHTKAACDQEHIDMIILSHATMPDRTQAIMTGDHKALLEAMAKDVAILESCGAAHIAIPCNTSHYFYDSIQKQTSVPIIHMVRESVRYAVSAGDNIRRIGIMGTDGTIRAGVYDKECRAMGIEAVIPSPERQRDVMSLIYDDIKSGKPGDPGKFERALDDLKAQQCDVVLLACTEISVFKRTYPVPDICLDAMDVLVRESILRSGASYID